MKRDYLTQKKRNGSYIIEALVSVSLIVVGLLGVFGLIIRSTSMNRDVQNRVTATYLAAEGIEVIKSIIDANVEVNNRTGIEAWNSGLASGTYEVQYDTTRDTLTSIGGASSTVPLLLDASSGRYAYNGGVPTPYYRTVRIEELDSETIRVSSVVEWVADGEHFSVFLQDIFTNWRERETPEYNPL